jgi:two-component system sensor histidine kinase KdpD
VGLLCARSDGPYLADPERGILSLAAGELGRLSERAGLLEAAAANDRLRATDEAKNALLAAVSHDLRTPLAAMKVAVTTLLEPSIELGETREQDMLQTVDGEIDRLNEMIGHLLDLSRFESGAFRLDRRDVSVHDLVRDAADRVRLSSGRDVETTTTPGLHVIGDRVRLLEAITNVLDNAARYSPLGSTVAVTANGSDGSVRIAVHDSGPGLTMEEQERLFRPFVRGGRAGSGTGLGLAITRSIVHAHGGNITVRSSDRGTEVVVALPVGDLPSTANGQVARA